jgi:aryl-phospho-beta-D-glucosidase BglC (GH1 family)
MQYFKEKNIKVGWNLGNTLDAARRRKKGIDNDRIAVETAWNNPKAGQILFNGLKKLGFDLIRLPVTWVGHIGPEPDYPISKKRLKRIAEVVDMARKAGFEAVIINMHHDESNTFGWLSIKNAAEDPQEKIKITAKFKSIWKQVAGHFAGYGDYLIFESFNEVQDGGWCKSESFTANPKAQMDILNEWNQVFTDVVRETGGNNASRFLMYPSYSSNAFCLLPDGVYLNGAAAGQYFKLPADSADGRQIVTFHFYDPFDYAVDAVSVSWDTPALKNDVDMLFKRFTAPYISKNIPVVIGEMGPRYIPGKNMDKKDKEIFTGSRIPYIEYIYRKAGEHGLIPVYWDDGVMFGMVNRKTGKPKDAHCAGALQAMMKAVKN